MAPDGTSPSERIAAFYQQLSVSATELNSVSDELGKSIYALDNALKKLNLGITAWVKISGDHDHGTGDFWGRYLGYAKVGGRWGIAISDSAGNYGQMPPDRDEEWLFNDAPRAFRVEAVAKLPELVEKLIEEAQATTKKIKEQTSHAQELAAAVTALAEPAKRK
jgi:hypothetical protein